MGEFMKSELKDWPIEQKKLSDLTPAAYNPRIISSSAKQGLAASLEKYGLVQSIVWNKRSSNIVGGHQRWKVLNDQFGPDHVVDVVVVDLNDTDEVALNIALNNPQIQGDFTDKTLEMLEEVAKQSQEEFSNLKLSDLRDELAARFTPEATKVHKVGKTKVTKKKNKEVVPDDKILITCPKCECEFRKSDKKILHQGTP